VNIPNPEHGRLLIGDKAKRAYPKFEGKYMLNMEHIEISIHLWNLCKHKDEKGYSILHIPSFEVSGVHLSFEKKPCDRGQPNAEDVGNWETLYEGYDEENPPEIPKEDTDYDNWRWYVDIVSWQIGPGSDA
jgi:hypothetical protein